MWILDKGKLIHTTDEKRETFYTEVSIETIERYKEIAKANDSTVSYLIESAIMSMLSNNQLVLEKEKRGDRIKWSGSFDKELLNQARALAKLHKVGMNTVIERGVNHIDLSTVKKKKWAYRTERKTP